MLCTTSVALVHRHHSNYRTVCIRNSLVTELQRHNAISFVTRCNEPALKTIIDETKKLKADLIEVSLLETLILCRKGPFYIAETICCLHLNTKEICVFAEYALSAAETKHIEHLTNGALIALGHYSLQRMQWTRFGKLLLALRCMSLRNFDSMLQQLFKNIINDIIDDRNIILT